MKEARTERIAANQRMAAAVGALNQDPAGLRTDYGVRTAQLEEGMEFAAPVRFTFDTGVRANVRPALARFVELANRHYPGR